MNEMSINAHRTVEGELWKVLKENVFNSLGKCGKMSNLKCLVVTLISRNKCNVNWKNLRK